MAEDTGVEREIAPSTSEAARRPLEKVFQAARSEKGGILNLYAVTLLGPPLILGGYLYLNRGMPPGGFEAMAEFAKFAGPIMLGLGAAAALVPDLGEK